MSFLDRLTGGLTQVLTTRVGSSGSDCSSVAGGLYYLFTAGVSCDYRQAQYMEIDPLADLAVAGKGVVNFGSGVVNFLSSTVNTAGQLVADAQVPGCQLSMLGIRPAHCVTVPKIPMIPVYGDPDLYRGSQMAGFFTGAAVTTVASGGLGAGGLSASAGTVLANASGLNAIKALPGLIRALPTLVRSVPAMRDGAANTGRATLSTATTSHPAPPAAANAAADGVSLSPRYKPGWTPAQQAAADAKVAALNDAAQAGGLRVTTVQRSGTSASSRYQSAGGTVPRGADVDHVIDLQLGGLDDIANMSPLDASVNRSLGSQTMWQFARC